MRGWFRTGGERGRRESNIPTKMVNLGPEFFSSPGLRAFLPPRCRFFFLGGSPSTAVASPSALRSSPCSCSFSFSCSCCCVERRATSITKGSSSSTSGSGSGSGSASPRFLFLDPRSRTLSPLFSLGFMVWLSVGSSLTGPVGAAAGIVREGLLSRGRRRARLLAGDLCLVECEVWRLKKEKNSTARGSRRQ